MQVFARPFAKAALGLAVLSCATGALAQIETLTAGQFPMGYGATTLSLSAEVLTAFDLGQVTVSNDVPVAYPALYPPLPSADALWVPNSASRVDLTDATVYTLDSTQGIRFDAAATLNISTGGSATISALSLDYASRTIYGTLTGSNGVGTVEHMAIWTADQLSSAAAGCTGLCDGPHADLTYRLDTTLTGLHMSSAAQASFAQSLGLIKLGQAALGGLTDWGTLSSSTMYDLGPNIHAVPEPSTWALMGLGLVGLGLVARRQQRR